MDTIKDRKNERKPSYRQLSYEYFNFKNEYSLFKSHFIKI